MGYNDAFWKKANYKALKVDLPPELTKRSWDNNKGKVAKAAGKTGVGEALSQVEKTYKNVNWDNFDADKTAKGRDTYTKWINDIKTKATSEANGNLKKFETALASTEKAARAAEAKFKKSRMIPKSATKLAGEVAKAAGTLRVEVGGKAMTNFFRRLGDALNNVLEYRINETKQSVAKVPVKNAGRVKTLKTALVAVAKLDPSDEKRKKVVAGIGDSLYDACRDYTQAIGNMKKFQEMGLDVGYKSALDVVYKKLVPWANKKQLTGLETTEVVREKVETFEGWHKTIVKALN